MIVSIEENFSSSTLSLEWASEALSEFTEAWEGALKDGYVGAKDVFDEERQHHVRKPYVAGSPPPILARRATEALMHTRHAFDQAAYAAQTSLHPGTNTQLYYPWCSSPDDLAGKLKGNFDSRLWDIFTAREPYLPSDEHAGGNKLGRSLARLSNSKHTIGLRLNNFAKQAGFPEIRGGYVGFLQVNTHPFMLDDDTVEIVRWAEIEYVGPSIVDVAIGIHDPKLDALWNLPESIQYFIDEAVMVSTALRSRCEEILTGPAP